MKTFNWGIIGTGSIAKTVVGAINFEETSKFYAVLSRTQEKADKFAKDFGGTIGYSDITKFLADKKIDAVYIASPHSEHFDEAKACLEAGVAVLCEKPMTVTAEESEKLIKIAREKKVFLMEAMWMKFQPGFIKTAQWINEGRIGEIKKINTNLCFAREFEPTHRLFDPKLAGGARLDLGVYASHYTTQFLGFDVEKLQGITTFAPNGVDLQDVFSLKYKNGALANITLSIKDFNCNYAEIIGTKGRIHVENFWFARETKLLLEDGTTEIYHKEFPYNGYEFEVAEVCKCLNEGKLESETIPLDMTLKNMQLLDKLKVAVDENR